MSSNLMIVWAYLTLCVILGFFRVPIMKSLKEYAVGSTRFNSLILIAATVATAIGPGETIGTAEKAFSIGALFVIPLLLSPIKWHIMGSVFSPWVVYLRQHNCMTLADVMKFLYGKWGRYVCLLGLIVNLGYLSVMYKGAGFVLEYYINIPSIYGAITVAICIAIYSILGGIHAVVITDTVQFFVFALVFPILVICGLQNLDTSAILAQLPTEKANFSWDNIPLALSLILYECIIPYTGFPFIQRGLMCANQKQALAVFQASGIVSAFFLFIMCFIGMVVAGLAPNIKSDNTIFYFIDHVAPSYLVGFIAVSFLAVIMSTASSFLNAVSIIFVKDAVKPLLPNLLKNDRNELVAAKLVGILVAVLSLCMTFIDEHIINLLWTLDNFWDPFVSIPLLMGLAGVRIKSGKFRFIVLITFHSILIARMIHGQFDTVTLAAGALTSVLTIFFFRDKSSAKMALHHEKNPDNNEELVKSSY